MRAHNFFDALHAELAAGDLALAAIRQTGGWAGNASDREMLQQARGLREKESLRVLPAAAAGLAMGKRGRWPRHRARASGVRALSSSRGGMMQASSRSRSPCAERRPAM